MDKNESLVGISPMFRSAFVLIMVVAVFGAASVRMWGYWEAVFTGVVLGMLCTTYWMNPPKPLPRVEWRDLQDMGLVGKYLRIMWGEGAFFSMNIVLARILYAILLSFIFSIVMRVPSYAVLVDDIIVGSASELDKVYFLVSIFFFGSILLNSMFLVQQTGLRIMAGLEDHRRRFK